MDGLIIINKEKGISSFGVVSRVRKLFNTKKVGHCGTLDPEAMGVLPIMIGNATKVSKYLVEHDKEYCATVKFGVKTDTADEEGNVLKTDDFRLKKEDKIKYVELLKSFYGKQEQLPPMYSAIKVNGKKLYEYARNGEEIQRNARRIEIYSIRLESLNFEENEMTFYVSCSKGTYIRTLCEDIAEKFGTIGYMKRLIRTRVDSFDIDHSVKLDELENEVEREKFVISLEEVFKDKEKIVLNNRKSELFFNGVKLTFNVLDGVYRIYNQESFLGLGVVSDALLKRDVVVDKT